MKEQRLRREFMSAILLATIAVLAGCNLPAPGSGSQGAGGNGPKVWFDEPLPETVIHLPDPCRIVAHGASPNGIAAFELSVNGAQAASFASEDKQSSLVTLQRDCGLSEPGRYRLQMRIQDNAGQWSDFAETSLVIVSIETPTPTLAEAQPTATDTPTPTVTPTTAVTGSISIERISDDVIYAGQASCGPLQVNIVARATAPKPIAVVVLFYRFSAGSSSGFESVAMYPLGGDLYQATLNPTSLLGGSVPFEQATLQYQVVVQQAGGDVSLRTPVMADIAVLACGTTKAACSSYNDKRSCVANGCNWSPLPGTVPLYACQNP